MRAYGLWRLVDAVTFGPVRRRRQLARLDDPLFLLQLETHPTRARRRRAPRQPGRVGAAMGWVVVLVVLAGVAVLGVHAVRHLRSPESAAAGPAFPAFNGPTELRPLGWPPVARDQARTRLQPAVAGPAGRGGYAFLQMDARTHTPVRWDPCEPIHYVIDPVGAPAGGTPLIRSAVAEVAARTGLTFAYDGPTSETLPAAGMTRRRAVQRDRYGNRWAPVLVTWATSATQRDLDGDVAGEAGPYAVSANGHTPVDVTGTVLLDSSQVTPAGSPMQRAMARAVVLHELGHLVGLDHVEDPTQIMNPSTTPGTVDFGAGDLRGLAILGAGRCQPLL